jgi:hypothetical protein
MNKAFGTRLGWHRGSLLAVLLTAAPAYAQQKIPFSDTLINPCTGEAVLVEGYTQVTTNIKEDPSNPERFHLVFNSQTIAQGTSSTGRKYNYGAKQHGNFKGLVSTKFRSQERMISQGSEPSSPPAGTSGSGDNWFLTAWFVTDKNGNVKRDFAESECRGGQETTS